MPRIVRTFGLVAVCATAMAGCATSPVTAPGPGRAVDPDALTVWTAKGRIALTAAGEGGSGSFVWQQRSERTELRVRGPLGAGGLDVVTDGERLEVQDGSGVTLDGDAARNAVEQRMGIPLPLAEFRYWMLGVPAPQSAHGPAERLSGGANGFTQSGWSVSYEGFRSAGGWSLPARVTATTGDARVRVVVDDWELPATP